MKISIQKIAKNFSYTFIANMISMLISTSLILIIPKFVGETSYGYWQLYLFYTSYISYMSLGITDGIYLRYGGWKYKELKKSIFLNQYWFLVGFNIVTGLIISIIYLLNSTSMDKNFIVILTCISGLLVVPRSLITFTLQATNRIKEYAKIIMIEKIVYFFIVLIFLLLNINNFKYLIVADIMGKIISNIYSIIICGDIVIGNLGDIKLSIEELKINFSVGIKLLIANLASILILGVVRFSIEQNWDIATFGKVSLTLSISNMIMLLINSMSIVLFPNLCNLEKEYLKNIYSKIRVLLTVVLLIVLLAYYPGKEILLKLLPKYEQSFYYMAILFPMCIFESKTLLLVNTYFKIFRKETEMMKINIFVVILGVVSSFISAFVLKNLNLTIINIIVLLAIRATIAEIKLSKFLNISILKNLIIDITISIIFILLSLNLNMISGLSIFSMIIIIYIYSEKKIILNIFNKLGNLKKKNYND